MLQGQTVKQTSSVRLSVSTSGPGRTLDDGYSWRKYGQIDVLNAKHPRHYYRCTFGHSQNCQAKKQVQRSDEDPTIFNVTYHGEHICTQPAAQTDVTHSLGHQLIMPTQNESDKQVMDITGGSSGQEGALSDGYSWRNHGQKDVLNAKYPRGQTVKQTSSVKLSVSTSGPGGTLDDGYRWRKYGQKELPNAKHPRGYYRCAFRNNQNCQATKQVQRSDEDPTIFNVTYHGEHICTQRAAQTDLTHSLGHQLLMPTQNESDKQVMLDFINPSFPIETHESVHSEHSTITSLSSTSFGGAFSSGFGSPGVSDVSDSSYFSAFPDEYGVDLEGDSSFDGSESELNDEYDDDTGANFGNQ